jgi:ferritin-like metal-binding protein YciE
MTPTVHSPADLFFDQMKDLHSMTSQVGEHLPDLVVVAVDEGLRTLLAGYSEGVAHHHQEILELSRRHGRESGNDKCKAIAGLIEGGNAHIASVADPGTRDLMIIAHVLRVIAYGSAAYEITSRLAGQLGHAGDAGVLLDLQQAAQGVAEELLALQPHIFQSASGPS